MLEHTKRPRTDKIELCFVGPLAKRDEAVRVLRSLGFVDTAETASVPWRKLFPEFEHEPSYSVALRGARKREGLTQKQLAELAGISQGHISAMETGKMTIGKERARRLAKVLSVDDYRIFI